MAARGISCFWVQQGAVLVRLQAWATHAAPVSITLTPLGLGWGLQFRCANGKVEQHGARGQGEQKWSAAVENHSGGKVI